MNSRLEQFVRDHREEFDTEEPDAKVWDAIQQDMKFVDPTKKKTGPGGSVLPDPMERGRRRRPPDSGNDLVF